MNDTSVAPCGIICDLCIGFQRIKNRCVGCNNIGYKPNYCIDCRFLCCPEKNDNKKILCHECSKFPCRQIKNLEKRYSTRYGESPINNLLKIKEISLTEFIRTEEQKWKCNHCGHLLCVHREKCLNCGSTNPFFPKNC